MTLAILVGGSALLAQLVNVGRRHSERAAEVTDAQTTAHNVMAEVLAGIRPWEATTSPTPIDFWSPWNVTITMDPVGLGNMTSVSILITERPELEATGGAALMSDATAASAASTSLQSPLLSSRDLDSPPAYRLTRWVRRAPPRSDTVLDEESLDSFDSTRERFGGGL